jgi:hypothetical protein
MRVAQLEYEEKLKAKKEKTKTDKKESMEEEIEKVDKK